MLQRVLAWARAQRSNALFWGGVGLVTIGVGRAASWPVASIVLGCVLCVCAVASAAKES